MQNQEVQLQAKMAQMNQILNAKNLEIENSANYKKMALKEIALISSALSEKDQNIQLLETRITCMTHEHEAYVRKT